MRIRGSTILRFLSNETPKGNLKRIKRLKDSWPPLTKLFSSLHTLLLVPFQELLENQCLIVLFISSSID